jgi:hypothetical protein
MLRSTTVEQHLRSSEFFVRLALPKPLWCEVMHVRSLLTRVRTQHQSRFAQFIRTFRPRVWYIRCVSAADFPREIGVRENPHTGWHSMTRPFPRIRLERRSRTTRHRAGTTARSPHEPMLQTLPIASSGRGHVIAGLRVLGSGSAANNRFKKRRFYDGNCARYRIQPTRTA